MLVRVFRVTDKFSNAALKLSVWLSNGFLDQVVYLRTSIETLIVGLWTSVSGTASTVAKSSQNVYQKAQKAVETTEQKRREVMAQRATSGPIGQVGGAVAPREMVIEDPMVTQNRTLSLFAVVLMVALIGIVLWSTSREGTVSSSPNNRGEGILPQNSPIPTEGHSLPTPRPTPTEPSLTFASWRGTLAFTVRESGQEDIFALQRNDAQPRRLTNDPADDRDPAWSPDGTTLAFVSNRSGSWDLYTLNVETQALTRLTSTTHFVGAPTWSPDGVFIAYEAYDPVAGNIDIYIVAADLSQGPGQLTTNPGPDIEPAWSPSPDGTGGRLIAYTSIRDGQQDIYIYDLDNPSDEGALNLTNTPDEIENYPAWSPDGQQVVYSSRTAGIETVYFRNINNPSVATAVGRGRMPVWNPVDGSSIFYAQQQRQNEWLISGAIPNSFGSSSSTLAINGVLSDLDWTPNEPVFQGVVANYPPIASASNAQPDADGLYNLAALPGVNAGEAYLNQRVAVSFNELRLKTTDAIGIDFLATLDSAFWNLERSPDIGQPRENWHYAGRAFAIPSNAALQDNPPPVVVVREDHEVGVYWRVYVRVAEQAQNGTRGEPLRSIPWDFVSRGSGDADAYELGGQLMETVPSGYYVDLTQLAADYGWFPIPSDRTWRQNFSGILFWEFVRTDGLTWREAMRELYTEDALNRFLNDEPVNLPTLVPEDEEETPTSVPQDEITPTRTPTPIPPDLQ